jgi:transposase-like protein
VYNQNLIFKKYTGIFAICTKGVIGWKPYEKGGITSDRLEIFLKNVITNKLKNKIIILDNASSHRNAKIKELIAKNNTLLYSVPYQHYTNAIENFFSLLKSKIRKMEGLSYNKLLENIRTAIKEIPKLRYENILKVRTGDAKFICPK